MSRFAGSTTRCFRAATTGRCRVPVKQAADLRTNSVPLSGAGQRAERLRPERESAREDPGYRPRVGLDIGSREEHRWRMNIAAVVVVAVVVFLTAALVIGLFLWAAVKDGREDRALQARLGIRRRTRLGR